MAHVPHFVPYQGSKRRLASVICGHFPANIDRLFEPFAGSAAITLYAAAHGLARRFLIADSLRPLIELHEAAIQRPQGIADAYEQLWKAQPAGAGATDYFYSIRERYNAERDPARLLFLILRCVANAVRFTKDGNFNQSPDKRRRGTHPDRLRRSTYAASRLLKGKVEFRCGDFAATLEAAGPGDFVYMDPPYQGTTEGADKRYFEQLSRDRLIGGLRDLDSRGVRYIVSYDGGHGEKRYGENLPADVRAAKFLVRAGRSTQGTLNGQDVITYESVYVSNRPAVAPPCAGSH